MRNVSKLKIGILGATGAVGQRFVQLLADHPWFEIVALAASANSAGKAYGAAVRWVLEGDVPAAVREQKIVLATPEQLAGCCPLLFSALPAAQALALEPALAAAGFAVFSNASAHRMAADVPLLIPEVNPEHVALIAVQQANRHWPGFIITNPNCSTTHLTGVLKPLDDAFGLRKVLVVTMQAASGAGYPGVPSLDLLDNMVPYIPGEEQKLESEPRKLLGKFASDRIVPADFVISAHANRVAVRDGHTEVVSLAFRRRPSVAEVVDVLRAFRGLPQRLQLPTAPPQPIIVLDEIDRPQPVLDRMRGRGMANTVGRVRECPLFHIKLVLLGHNTIRGAAGGSILNAELLARQGYFPSFTPESTPTDGGAS